MEEKKPKYEPAQPDLTATLRSLSQKSHPDARSALSKREIDEQH